MRKIKKCNIAVYFYPRSPCGERRLAGLIRVDTRRFLSTLSLRRATFFYHFFAFCYVISIHALLAESDINNQYRLRRNIVFLSTLSLRRATKTAREAAKDKGISIHALLAESDQPADTQQARHRTFLSTLSLRRATRLSGGVVPNQHISIHALLAESDKTPHISN